MGPINVPTPPIATTTTTTALLNVGTGSTGSPITTLDTTKDPVAGVWGYVGSVPAAPSQTSQPPITCAVYGQGGVVGKSQGFVGTIEDSDASGGDGVVGFGNASGVHGISTSGYGLKGTSTGGQGVAGTSENSTGVMGISTKGVGVGGESKSNGAGVYGLNSSSANGGPGVYGSSKTYDGVHGESQSNQHAGVSGVNTAKTAEYTGGGSGVPAGVYGSGNPGGYFQGNPAGFFEGDVTVTGNVTVTKTLTAIQDVVLGSDCAEDFDIAPTAEIDPGTVMVLTDNGAVQPSQNAYDKKVAGVISGAGDLRPGLILGRCDSLQERMPLALVGKVYCKVDADPAPIAIGDLLTTSARPGFGMKATDSARAFGAVIGKALRAVPAGQGLIPILVALQ